MRANVWAKKVLPQPVGPSKQHVGLGQFDVVVATRTGLNALVVVVDGNRENLLCFDLTDHELVQEGRDFAGRRNLVEDGLGAVTEFVGDDFVTERDALVTDVHGRAGDQFANLLLTLGAETALDEVAAFTELCHDLSLARSPLHQPRGRDGEKSALAAR
jgi:hypothetical protein